MARLVRTPRSVITAAVFLYIYGGLMLLCFGCSGIEFLANDRDDAIHQDIAREAPGNEAMSLVVSVLNLPTGVLMILAAGGLLKLKPAARNLACAVTLIDIVLSFMSMIYTVSVVIPAQDRVMAAHAANMPPEFGAIVNTATWGWLAFAIALVLIFCVPVPFLLSTPTVRAAFASEEFEIPRAERRPPYDDSDDDPYRAGPPPAGPADPGITRPR